MNRTMRILATGAIAAGLAAGSYGVASAASSSGSSSSSGTSSAAGSAPSAAPQGWGHQRSDETLLTGETAAKVQAAAVARVPGATVSRVETDADGHAAYEVHMVRSDGTLVTVYVDKSFDVVGVEDGMPGPPAQQPPATA
jgi:peptidase YpeB-like protein